MKKRALKIKQLQPTQPVAKKGPCQYGASCYIKSLQHGQEYGHPFGHDPYGGLKSPLLN